MTALSISDLVTPAQRQRLVSLFASRLAEDDLLGPVFGNHSRPSGRELAWWEQALTGMRYYGRLLTTNHAGPLCSTYFDRWCKLLQTTFNENFHGPLADEAKGHVLNVATMLGQWQLARQQNQGSTPALQAA